MSDIRGYCSFANKTNKFRLRILQNPVLLYIAKIKRFGCKLGYTIRKGLRMRRLTFRKFYYLPGYQAVFEKTPVIFPISVIPSNEVEINVSRKTSYNYKFKEQVY